MPNNAYNLLKLIRNATYSYMRTNSLDKKIISTLGVAEGAVSALALVKSDGTVVISGDQFATIGASTTALTGALTVGDTTTPSITTLSGKTNTGFLSILGKSSGGIKVLPADASGYLITVTNATQTVGTSTWTLPDAANVAQTFVTLALAQTLTNKTLTAPAITAFTATGTSTIAAGLTVTAPAIVGATITGTVTIGNGCTMTTPVLGAATGTSLALTAGLTEGVTTISGDGAVTIASGTVVLTKGSAAAITVAAPSSNDGVKIRIISNSDFAHVVTFTGATLLDGTTGANLTVTMTAFKGSAIEVVAVGTKWLLVSSSNVTSITV